MNLHRSKAKVEKGHRVVSLGGDHSITYPIIRAFGKKYKKLNILHLDAHPDLYDELDGNPHSHASPFARIMEEVIAKRLVQVGIRTLTGHHKEQVKRFGVKIIAMKISPPSRILSSIDLYIYRWIWIASIQPLRREYPITNPAARVPASY
jgi:arginase family enzyme